MPVLHKWEKVRHQVAILGHVRNAQTDEALEGIVVRISDGPPEFMERVSFLEQLYGEENWAEMKVRLDQTRTARDGNYHFMDLPEGDYTLLASFSQATRRFGSDERTATVAHDNGIIWDRVNFQLPVSTLKGRVTSAEDDGDANDDDDDDEAIHMAEVRVLGSGERTFSDGDGNYSLVGIEYGERTVAADAMGYHGEIATVTIAAAGAVETHDFSLMPESPGD